MDLTHINFCDPHTYDTPWDTYASLRAHPGLWYDQENNLYIAARHTDVRNISLNPQRYCNSGGVRPGEHIDLSLITKDGTEHTRLRKLISAGFTPRQIRTLTTHVNELADELATELACGTGTSEFVPDVAAQIPLIVICELLGLDITERHTLYRWSETMMAGDGRTGNDPELTAAAHAYGEFATAVADAITERRAERQDDLLSTLAHPFEHQGEWDQLSDNELLTFAVVLMVAGNETTRNAITGALIGLSAYPDQRRWLTEHLHDPEAVSTAVDELIRWVSPVLGFIRTATETHTYEGTELCSGDQILMLYQAANRDENVFNDPELINLERSPNPHLAFGVGAHYCLGANLARMEVREVLNALLTHVPDITIPDGVSYTRGASTLVLGLADVTATYTPRPAAGCPVAH